MKICAIQMHKLRRWHLRALTRRRKRIRDECLDFTKNRQSALTLFMWERFVAYAPSQPALKFRKTRGKLRIRRCPVIAVGVHLAILASGKDECVVANAGGVMTGRSIIEYNRLLERRRLPENWQYPLPMVVRNRDGVTLPSLLSTMTLKFGWKRARKNPTNWPGSYSRCGRCRLSIWSGETTYRMSHRKRSYGLVMWKFLILVPGKYIFAGVWHFLRK